MRACARAVHSRAERTAARSGGNGHFSSFFSVNAARSQPVGELTVDNRRIDRFIFTHRREKEGERDREREEESRRFEKSRSIIYIDEYLPFLSVGRRILVSEFRAPRTERQSKPSQAKIGRSAPISRSRDSRGILLGLHSRSVPRAGRNILLK